MPAWPRVVLGRGDMDLPWWHRHPHCVGTEPGPSSQGTLSLQVLASSCPHKKCHRPHGRAPVPCTPQWVSVLGVPVLGHIWCFWCTHCLC